MNFIFLILIFVAQFLQGYTALASDNEQEPSRHLQASVVKEGTLSAEHMALPNRSCPLDEEISIKPPPRPYYYHKEYSMTLFSHARHSSNAPQSIDEDVFDDITTQDEAFLYADSVPAVVEKFQQLPESASGTIWAYQSEESFDQFNRPLWCGSAAMLAHHCALTAAHCLHTHEPKQYTLALMSYLQPENPPEPRKLYIALTDDRQYIKYKALNDANEVNEAQVSLTSLQERRPDLIVDCDNFDQCIYNVTLKKALLRIAASRQHVQLVQPQFFVFVLHHLHVEEALKRKCSGHYVAQRWRMAPDHSHDYGLLYFDDITSPKAGCLQLAIEEKALENEHICVVGFPGAKWLEQHGLLGNLSWVVSDPFVGVVMVSSHGMVLREDNGLLYYNANTLRGQSGGCVVLDDGTTKSKHFIYGIHTRGGRDPEIGNSGVRVKGDVLQTILQWYDESLGEIQRLRQIREQEQQKRDVQLWEKGEAKGREVGEAKGREVGEAKGREVTLEVIRMIQQDRTVQDISEVTGLSEDQVNEIVQTLVPK